MKKLLLSIAFLCSMGGVQTAAPEVAQPKQLSAFEEIAQLHLNSFPNIVVEQSAPAVNQPKGITELLAFDKTIKPLADKELYTELYQLLAPQFIDTAFNILSKQSVKEIELVCGQDTEGAHVAKLLKRTITSFGDIYMTNLLCTPVQSIKELSNRQEMVKFLVDNEFTYDHLHTLLTSIKKSEAGFLNLYRPETADRERVLNMYFYWEESGLFKQFAFMNSSARWQEVLTQVRNAKFIYAMGEAPFLHYYFPNAQKAVFDFMRIPAKFRTPLLVCGQALNTYMTYHEFNGSKNALNYLQTQMIELGRIVKAVDACNKLVQAHPELQHLEHAQQLNFLTKTSSAQLKRLIKLLRTKTFSGEASVLSWQGRVRAAYKLMKQVKEAFIPTLQAIGELDAYMSIATLVKETANDRCGYNFVTYLDQETPAIELNNLWNPFVGSEKAVGNSITLGNNNACNIILTGPNAGGKSTFLKGTTLAVILGQTIGIAPVESLAFTPFAKITTYMNISDDTGKGKSLFQMEVDRAQALYQTVTALKDSNKQFTLSIMDEMFSGTSPKEGSAATYAVAENLGKMQHSILLLATHYPELQKLEKEHNHLFKNYKVTVTRHEDGTFTRPFKLEEGAANQNVALEMLGKAFEGDIMQRAQEILNNNQIAHA